MVQEKITKNQSLPMVKNLKKRKYALKVDEIKGANHDWKNWKPQLDDILIYFLGIEN